MTIRPFNASTYSADRNTANLVRLKDSLDAASTQLATGRTSETYGGLGPSRTTSLSAHATLSALDGYDAAIGSAQTRVALTSTSVSQIVTLGDRLQTTLNATTRASAANTTQVARSSLEAAVDALNQSVAGQFVFGGRSTDDPPVASADTILNGDPATGADGLKTMILEQKTADLGPNRNGRVSSTVSGRSVRVAEEGTGTAGTETRANFGFKLVSATSSNPSAIAAGATVPGTTPDVTFGVASPPKEGDRIRVALNQPDGTQTFVDLTARANGSADPEDTIPLPATAAGTAAYLDGRFKGLDVASIQGDAALGLSADFGTGTPAQVSLDVAATPKVGDTVTVELALRDGTTQTITLTARASADAASATDFSIGGDVAANLSQALNNALTAAAATTLSASSTTRAADDFFAGSKSAGLAPRRVSADGAGYAEQASTKTVIWYTGDDTSADPRATATVQSGAGRTLNIGVQANEAPIRAVLAGMAAFAADGTSASVTAGSTEDSRLSALYGRARSKLDATDGDGGVQTIASDISLAATSMTNARSQNRATRATLQDALDGVDSISTNDVTAQILALQTQLQASYQVTSLLSKLSLVNYLN